MTSPSTSLTLAVPTFRRVGLLAALLPRLQAQADDLEQRCGWLTRILVIDNDAGMSARQTALAAEVAYVVEPERGLSAVRNRAISESHGSRVLVFIDDDEVPAPGWLSALVVRWHVTGAAAVSGRVETLFPRDVDPWILAGGFFTRVHFSDGTRQPAAATNNLLLDLERVRAARLCFDDAFSLSGGEDIHFTRRLVAAGGTIVSATDALVYDPVAPERLNRQWVLRRAYRVGVSTARVDASLAPNAVASAVPRASAVAGGVARVVGGGIRWLVGSAIGSAVHSARGARAVARGGGLVLGALGADYAEYARPR